MIDSLLTISAISIAIVAYTVYYFRVKKSGIIPNRLAWIICSASISLETITYCFVSNDYIKSLYFIVSAICCILITIKIWPYAKWDGSSRAQKNSLVFYSLAIAIWPLFHLPFIAHLLLLAVIPVTFFPIYLSAFNNYKTENSLPWLLWSVSDLVIIISILSNMKTIQELPYAVVNFICPFIVYSIIIFQRVRHSTSHTFRFFMIKWVRGY
jgi:hypothetical protein